MDSEGGRKSPCILLIAILLAIMTLVVYWPVNGHDFIDYDDPLYVTNNLHIHQGLTWQGVSWAFTADYAKNWHPLTWISHMADVQLFGAYAGGHHMTNVVFHIINILLLFYLLHETTGFIWRSAFVAAFFAMHPLHVESVVWISERKDVLSTCFWLLTLLAYIEYVKRPCSRRSGAIVLFFVLGLLSKPMVVTLPFVMLLMDYWPLQRFSFQEKGWNRSTFKLLWEKTPLIGLSAFTCLITYQVQSSGGAVGTLSDYAPGERFANALSSYVEYMGKMFWPKDLTVFYPYPQHFYAWQTAGAAIFLIATTILALLLLKRRPWFAVGWFWYTGTLIPVIGLVQVGLQSHADRYTYIPLIGLFIIVVWAVAEFAGKRPWLMSLSFTAGFVVIVALGFFSRIQIGYWKDTETLFSRALAVTESNYVAHLALGNLQTTKGDWPRAVEHYKKSLMAKPDYADAHNNLGHALAKQGINEQALIHYQEAVRIDPKLSMAHNNLGQLLLQKNDFAGAIEHFRLTVQYNPEDQGVHKNLERTLELMEKKDRSESSSSENKPNTSAR